MLRRCAGSLRRHILTHDDGLRPSLGGRCCTGIAFDGWRQKLQVAAATRRHRNEGALLVEIQLSDDLHDAADHQRIEDRLHQHFLIDNDAMGSVGVVVHGHDGEGRDPALAIRLDLRLPIELSDQVDVIERGERERHGIPNR
ncbi:hypothetical protein [Bosea sp. RAC05]|uniref:hypothetical protein n=1 Tax=Bosea sp. RAC05 TaxID=1842539 RepID=UPI00083E26C3|nr:hypothetical protein [Bosea sp. RAC05]